MVIINLHGFNSGPGDKAEQLQKAFPGCDVVAPQLPYDPLQAIQVVNEILAKYSEDEIHIVGTSLGAFYTMYLSTLYRDREEIFYYLINPSFKPHKTLARYSGETLTNFKTKEQFKVSLPFLVSLEEMYASLVENYTPKCIYYSNYFIGTKDEVLNFTDVISFIQSYKVPYRLHYSNQDHRYCNILDVIQQLRENNSLFI